MSRPSFPFAADDISAVARSLRGQLAASDRPPGHVELLNMLARATGHRNFQHFRAQAAAQHRLVAPEKTADPVDHQRIERAAGHFDRERRLIRWPGKASHQQLCLWALWAAIPAGRTFSEREINEMLAARHLFGDHALLRRALYDAGLLFRTADVRVYRRIERKPPAEALALIRHLEARMPASARPRVMAGG